MMPYDSGRGLLEASFYPFSPFLVKELVGGDQRRMAGLVAGKAEVKMPTRVPHLCCHGRWGFVVPAKFRTKHKCEESYLHQNDHLSC